MSTAAPSDPFAGIDLVEGTVHLWAGGPDGEVFASRPDGVYTAPGLGRVVVATALARAAAAGRIDLGERGVLERGRDLGDRGVLATLGPGLNPTWGDLLVIALTLEDPQAVMRLCARLGPEELSGAAAALGLDARALDGYPAAPPRVSARAAAAAMLRLETAAGDAGFARIIGPMRDVRYRWRVRTRLAEAWQLGTQGSRRRATVEEVALWRTARGWAAAAVAFTDVEDAWRAEYLMGDGFRRVVEGVGVPVGDEGGSGR